MAVMGLDGMKPKTLSTMNKGELQDICKGLEITYHESDTMAILTDRIKESGKYETKGKETGGGVVTKDGKKTHKTLGEYRKCIVHPTEHSQQNTSIFCSIGLYTVEFQPRTEISLPQGIIDFLKQASVAKHSYDKTKISENGQIGSHVTTQVPKYIVEIV